MKSEVCFFIGLILGCAAGAIVTKIVDDKKFEDRVADATLEAKEYYKNKFGKNEEKVIKKNQSNLPDEMIFFNKKYGCSDDETESDSQVSKDIYEIQPEDYGEDDEFATLSLDYYLDDILVDENGNVVDHPKEICGDFLDELSGENPTIYIHNDNTKSEYEVCFINSEYYSEGIE